MEILTDLSRLSQVECKTKYKLRVLIVMMAHFSPEKYSKHLRSHQTPHQWVGHQSLIIRRNADGLFNSILFRSFHDDIKSLFSPSPNLSISTVLGTRLRPETKGWTEQKLENSGKLILPFYNFIWWNLKPPWPHFCVSWTLRNYKTLFVDWRCRKWSGLFNYWRRSWERRGAAADSVVKDWEARWGVLTDPNHPGEKWNYSLTLVTVNYRSYLEEGKGSFSS